MQINKDIKIGSLILIVLLVLGSFIYSYVQLHGKVQAYEKHISKELAENIHAMGKNIITVNSLLDGVLETQELSLIELEELQFSLNKIAKSLEYLNYLNRDLQRSDVTMDQVQYVESLYMDYYRFLHEINLNQFNEFNEEETISLSLMQITEFERMKKFAEDQKEMIVAEISDINDDGSSLQRITKVDMVGDSEWVELLERIANVIP